MRRRATSDFLAVPVESLRPTRLGPLEGYETCTCSNGFVCSDDQSGGSDLRMGAAAARCASRPEACPEARAGAPRVDDPPAAPPTEPPFYAGNSWSCVTRGLTAFTKVNLRHTTPSHTYNKNGQRTLGSRYNDTMPCMRTHSSRSVSISHAAHPLTPRGQPPLSLLSPRHRGRERGLSARLRLALGNGAARGVQHKEANRHVREGAAQKQPRS